MRRTVLTRLQFWLIMLTIACTAVAYRELPNWLFGWASIAVGGYLVELLLRYRLENRVERRIRLMVRDEQRADRARRRLAIEQRRREGR